MGLGVLGGDAAVKLLSLGFKVAGWSRTRKHIPGVHCYAGAAEFDSFLRRTDILVSLLPQTPETTHIFIEHIHDNRRIHTDGRPWPKDLEPTFAGLSLGKWIDTDGDGKYDLLEIETRNLRGPRSFDFSGLPLSSDNDTIVKERIYLDKNNPNVLIDEMTTTDGALTRPWSVVRKWSRVKTVSSATIEAMFHSV